MAFKKGIAAIFRFKSRKLASSFSQWKYKAQFMRYMQSYINYKQNNIPKSHNFSSNKASDIKQNAFRQSLVKKKSPLSYNDSQSSGSEHENIDENEELDEKSLSQ